MSRDAPIPRCPMSGHAWGNIVCKQDATWLCSYKTDSIASSSHHKYVFLSANSKIKGMNDMKKYEKARRLKLKIAGIR
jgi:DNA topoisomerase-1